MLTFSAGEICPIQVKGSKVINLFHNGSYKLRYSEQECAEGLVRKFGMEEPICLILT